MSEVSKFKEYFERALSENAMRDLFDSDVGPLVIATIDQRTRRGEFLGGDKKDKPYSDKPIPAFYLGRLERKGSSYSLRSDKQNTTASVPLEDVFWRVVNGRRMAFFDKGYAGWRVATGRGLKVDLTFTGMMLNSMHHKILSISGNEIHIGIEFSPEQDQKAYYVNLQREFVGLSPEEHESISQYLFTKLSALLE